MIVNNSDVRVYRFLITLVRLDITDMAYYSKIELGEVEMFASRYNIRVIR